MIAGVVAGVNLGLIENCMVIGGGVSSYMGEEEPYLYWLDFNCFIAGFVGINGGSGYIKNCVCAVDYVEYVNNPKCVRAFCGKSWGTIVESIVAADGVITSDIKDAPTLEEIDDDKNKDLYEIESIDLRDYYDGFAYLALQPHVGYMGSLENCFVGDSDEIMGYNVAYANFDTEIWKFKRGEYPVINHIYK